MVIIIKYLKPYVFVQANAYESEMTDWNKFLWKLLVFSWKTLIH